MAVDFQLQHARHWQIVLTPPPQSPPPPPPPASAPPAAALPPAHLAPASPLSLPPSPPPMLARANYLPALPPRGGLISALSRSTSYDSAVTAATASGAPPPPPGFVADSRPAYPGFLPWAAAHRPIAIAGARSPFKSAAPCRLQCKAPGCTQTFSHRSSRSRHHKRFHSKKLHAPR